MNSRRNVTDPESLAGWVGFLQDGEPNNSFSGKLEAARLVSSGPCRLFGFQGLNTKAAAQFILVFDTDSLPGAGALPVFPIAAAASSEFSAFFGDTGRWFERGIVLANSSTADSLTAGSADCWFDAQYI